MTSEPLHQVIYPEIAEANILPPRNDMYIHISGRESGDPQLVETAWRIHAEGYHAMGFVTDDAITSEGYLAEGIDKSRGENTDYYLAINPHNSEDVGTMRKINVPTGGDYRDLPAFELCANALNAEGRTYLSGLENQEERVKEIGAFAKTEHAHPLALHEIIRNVIHEAIGKDEVWFYSIVSTTHDTLTKSFGKENFWVIGEDVAINDDRVESEITLRPVIVRPDTFIDNVLAAYRAADNPVDKVRLMRSFKFLTDGLDPSKMSDEVHEACQEIQRSQN